MRRYTFFGHVTFHKVAISQDRGATFLHTNLHYELFWWDCLGVLYMKYYHLCEYFLSLILHMFPIYYSTWSKLLVCASLMAIRQLNAFGYSFLLNRSVL